ncbi:8990_t:CDS:2 [Diversispora eburnea]|uniref:8990_t:CDS:1 n=1 Tax=Diversispora eburnea TaxID=1213867 RepID=A0A9N9G3T7_9GLOM|nr:8990_t:CDS:2 [Diversispora eburnea]
MKDFKYDTVEFLKMIKKIHCFDDYDFIAKNYGISKNPTTQNYIFVTESFDDDLHNFLAKTFWDLGWEEKINILFSIASGLEMLHTESVIHCNLHSGNILNLTKHGFASCIDLDLFKLESELILNSNNKNRKIYGSIPYLPPELMYRCWSDDPSERPSSTELSDLFCEIFEKFDDNIVDNDVMRQHKIADENQKNTSKSQKQELFELFSHSSKLHPQTCYISRYIHTLHGLHYLLEDLKSGKSADPNLLLKSNEPTASDVNTTYNINY